MMEFIDVNMLRICVTILMGMLTTSIATILFALTVKITKRIFKKK